MFNLPRTILDSDLYINSPYKVFEIKNFLSDEDFEKLSKFIKEFDNFDDKFDQDKGGKEKKSFNGSNIKHIKNSFFRDFCSYALSKKFYYWFKKTHLIFHDSALPVYVLNRNTVRHKISRKIVKIFKLPISFYYTEIEVGSLKPGAFIPPHIDSSHKRLSLVLYVNNNALSNKQRMQLGTVFFKQKNRVKINFNGTFLSNKEDLDNFYNNFEPFHTALYENNVCAGFIKNNISWHAVKENCYDFNRTAIVINTFEEKI